MSATCTEETCIGTELTILNSDKPYRKERVLRELYHEKELSLAEVATKLGCCRQTVRRWMKQHGLERRTEGGQRTERATFSHDGGGHELWTAREPDGSTAGVYVHQLTAIANGSDASEVFADENVVHHGNNIAFDNRPENITVVSRTQHRQIHAEAGA